MEDFKSDIKKFALEQGADIVGIAPADTRTQRVFTQCRSAVVLAVKLLDGALDNSKNVPVQYTLEHRYANILLNDIGHSVARYIEGRSHKAMYIFSRGGLDLKKDKDFLERNVWRHIMGYGVIDRWIEKHFCESVSFKQLGREAGLGCIGKCGLLISEQYGVRIDLGVVLTDCPLEPDETAHKNFCRPDKCGFRCVTLCPGKAISKSSVFNGIRCYKYKLSLQRKGMRELECGRCVASCPAQIKWRE